MAKYSDPSRIAVIAVNYETDALAVRFVSEITALAKGIPLKIVLVDNTERTDATEFFDLVLSENSDVLCIKSSANLGYFRGAWHGLKQCWGSDQAFDWVIVANVDIRFPDSEFFVRLGAVKPTGEMGVIAPSILSGLSRHDQNPMMTERPSPFRMRCYRRLHRSFYLLNLYEVLAAAYHLARSTIKPNLGWRPAGHDGASKPVPIYAPHGACMIFSNEFFARGGSLEVPFFLYGEEIYVAETARALGLQVIYNPSLRLQHDEHQSTGLGGVLLSRQSARYLQETTDCLVETYFS